MKNGRTRKINYKPRYTQMEAYDLLPVEVRRALQEGAQQWNTNSTLRYFRKLKKQMGEYAATDEVVKWLWRAHHEEVGNPKAWGKECPHVMANATLCVSYSKDGKIIKSKY